MRKAVLLNAPIASVVAHMGHTDSLCIGDAGLPIPETVERIDLAVTKGLPRFLDVLQAVTGELCVERATIAQEMVDQQPEFHREVLAALETLQRAQGNEIAVETVPHEAFKALTGDCHAVIRTGEVTPYANIILHAGVTF